MKFNFRSEKLVNALIASIGAFLCIFIISYINSIDLNNLWLIPPFGASLVLVMAVHDNPLANPKNVFFGHVFSAASGVLIFSLIGNSSLAIALALGLAVFIMLITKTVHPPAGANPIIAILGERNFEFIIMPVAIGATFIILFAVIYNKLLKRS